METAVSASITTLNSSSSVIKRHHLYPCFTSINTQKIPKYNYRYKNSITFLTSCSTKPDTNKDNVTDPSSIDDPSLNPNIQNSPLPTSHQALSSAISSFSRGLVFNLGQKNAWDSAEVGSPVVRRFLSDEEERWYMWYHGSSGKSPGSDYIGLAVSNNGIHWERGGGAVQSSVDVGLVMNCSKDWWAFDTQGIRPGEVVVMSSSKIRANSAVYWLYYTGFSSEEAEVSDSLLKFRLENPERLSICFGENNENGGIGKIYKSLPGLAMSQDGRHWARIEGEHHSGALFDVGSEGDWDSLFIASPQVVFHKSGDLRMYYHSFDMQKGQFAVGMARSRDGMRWVKLGKIIGGGGSGCFNELGAVNAQVVKNKKDGTYVMAYEGVAADGKRSIGLAVSVDGLKNWRVQDSPVLKWSEEDGWDDKGVGSPCLVEMDGEEDEWKLYYRGIGKAGQIGIGMAVSSGSDLTSFKRCQGFHL